MTREAAPSPILPREEEPKVTFAKLRHSVGVIALTLAASAGLAVGAEALTHDDDSCASAADDGSAECENNPTNN